MKAAATNKQRYGLNFYRSIGRLGGKKQRGGGFASAKIGRDGLTGAERARVAGIKGGVTTREGYATGRLKAAKPTEAC